MKIKHISSSQHENGGFLVILQDATHRALSKERIRTLRDEYLAIFNNPFVGRLNQNGRVRHSNVQSETLDILKANIRRSYSTASSLPSTVRSFIATLQREKKMRVLNF